MLRWEADELANWFEEVSRETPRRADIEFVEPDLRFDFQNRAGEPVIMRIQFEAEFLPPWGGDTRGRAHVDIQVSVEDLANAAESLREELLTFPAR